MILKIDNQNFNEKVIQSEKPVIIDFYADWCGPCKMMSPIVDQIAEELGEKATVGKINVDENQDLAMEYGVMSIPTIIFFKDGSVQKTFVGVREKEEIINEIQ